MNAAKSVTACFMQVFPLTVSVTGQGTVSPSGGTYDIGTEVSLAPPPDTGDILRTGIVCRDALARGKT